MSQAGTTSGVRYSIAFGLVGAAIIGALIGVALTATAPIPGVADVSEVVSAAIGINRVLLNLAAVATVGFSLLPVLVGGEGPGRAAPVLLRARQAALVSAVVWSVLALVMLILQTAEFRPRASTIGVLDVWDYVVTVGAGKALLIVAALALAHAVLGTVSLRLGERVPAELRIGLGLFALLPLPVTGHASNWAFRDYTMISVELHVMSAVTWTGGLVAMAVLLLGNRTLLARALPRFSRLATVCLALTALTGLFNGIVEIVLNPKVTLFAGLLGTPYGLLVLLKTTCVVLIALFGAHIRWRLLPRIVRHQRTALATWATLEVTVMGLAFGFAAVLSRAPVS
ncbi:putative copper resistance protein D [Amycolatopsis marina]|uniref:Putative copper resistance protein D n=1 Tax=Amycolatopsis marina TaxID=490629 RepID=A0A1I0W222_9PSEU|nr:CopD family protein [Amycolatopsis marina]SFA82672.1 putative copper resistance protein D [Amycolatopsis marina]